MSENVLDVVDHQLNRGVGISASVRAEEAGCKVDADKTGSLTNRSQLLVSEISRMWA